LVSRPFRALRNPPSPLSPSLWPSTAPLRSMAARTSAHDSGLSFTGSPCARSDTLSSISESEEDAASQAAAFVAFASSTARSLSSRASPTSLCLRSPSDALSASARFLAPISSASLSLRPACLPSLSSALLLSSAAVSAILLTFVSATALSDWALAWALRSDATWDSRSTTRSRLASDSVLNSSTALSWACLLIQPSASSSLLRAMREAARSLAASEAAQDSAMSATHPLSTPTAPLAHSSASRPTERTQASLRARRSSR